MASQKYVSLDGAGSADGIIDLQGISGKSLYSDTGIPATYARYVLASRFYGSQFLRNYPVYSLVFANDLVKTVSLGVVDDFMQFDGSAYKLYIRTPSAGSSNCNS